MLPWREHVPVLSNPVIVRHTLVLRVLSRGATAALCRAQRSQLGSLQHVLTDLRAGRQKYVVKGGTSFANLITHRKLPCLASN